MRWLYLCSDLGIPLDGTKGASEHVRAITAALARRGQDVFVLSPRGRLPAGHPARQIDVPFGAGARRFGDMARHWLSASESPTGMASELSQMFFDAHLLDALINADIDIPEVDVVVERLALFSTAGREWSRRMDLPYLIEMNSPMAQEAATFRDATLQKLARDIETQTLKSADCVMTVSIQLRSQVIESTGIDHRSVVTVPNGVDLRLFADSHCGSSDVRRELGIASDAVVFGFVGSLKVWHGVDALIEAFLSARTAIRHAHLVIIGDGRRLDYYQSETAAMGLSNCVSFVGGIPHARVARLLAAVDVAVAPYLSHGDFYFSPLKLYEYMAAGKCIVASRAGQIEEVIEDGVNGLLCRPNDAADLADKMIRAGHDAGLRAEMGHRAREQAGGLGWDRTADRIIDLATGAIESKESCPMEVAS